MFLIYYFETNEKAPKEDLWLTWLKECNLAGI